MGRIVDSNEWNVIQSSADALVNWNNTEQSQVELAIKLVKRNKINEFKFLLKKGLNFYLAVPVNINGISKCTLLTYLTYHNKMEFIKICDELKPNWALRNGVFDPLDSSILAKNDECVNFLLSKRCYNLKTTKNGQNIKIISATKNSYLYGVGELLKSGANPDLGDNDGHTALWHNLKIHPQTYEDVEIARLLLSYGATNPKDVSEDDLEDAQINALEEGMLRQSVDLVETPEDPKVEQKPKPKIKIL